MDIDPIYGSIVCHLSRTDHLAFAATCTVLRKRYKEWRMRRKRLGEYWLCDVEGGITRPPFHGRAGVVAALHWAVSHYHYRVLVPIQYWRHTGRVLLGTKWDVLTFAPGVSIPSGRHVPRAVERHYSRLCRRKLDSALLCETAMTIYLSSFVSGFTFTLSIHKFRIEFVIGDKCDTLCLTPASRQTVTLPNFTLSGHSGHSGHSDPPIFRHAVLSANEILIIQPFTNPYDMRQMILLPAAVEMVGIVRWCIHRFHSGSNWCGGVIVPQAVINYLFTVFLTEIDETIRIGIMHEGNPALVRPDGAMILLITETAAPGMDWALDFVLDFCQSRPRIGAKMNVYCPFDPLAALNLYIRPHLVGASMDELEFAAANIISRLPEWADAGRYWVDFPARYLATLPEHPAAPLFHFL